MTETDEELNELVEKVLELASDANAEAVKTEFERYRDEFLIPPKDAMRSVLRKFEVAEEEVETAARSALSRMANWVAGVTRPNSISKGLISSAGGRSV